MEPESFSKYRPLSECTADGKISYGIVQPGTHFEQGVPIIRVNNINKGSLDISSPIKVHPAIEEKHRKTRLVGGEVLLTIVGSVGQSIIVGTELAGWNVARAIAVIRPSLEIGATWINICLQSKEVQHFLDTRVNTTVQKTLNLKDVRDIPILIVSKEKKRFIEGFWNSINDKIELNKRINATLEGMAQALFKSWFVNFDPVIDNALVTGNPIPEELSERAALRRKALADGSANRETAKSFPASFQLTESMGWIPEGYELRSLDFLAKLDTTSVKPFKQPETLWEHYSIPAFDSSRMPVLEKGSDIKSNKYLIKPKAVLSSKLNPETERTWWPFILDKNNSICSTEFMQFVPLIEKEQAFVYSLIRSKPFQANILERVTGSTGSRQRAQPKQIAKIDVADCGELLRRQFVKVALPLFQSIRNNLIQSRYLSNLRDTLLPKLISGELRVSNAEKLAGNEL